MKNKRGFTLAEVLVTLAVIGVVAALTIPTIIQSSGEKQAKTAVRKAISITNQVLAMSIAENGVSGSSVNNTAELEGLFKDYMKVLDDSADNSFVTADGMIYSFHKAVDGTDHPNRCGDNDTDDPDSANCIIEVDINGNSGANKAASIGSYTDLYYLIVRDNTVNPANANGSWSPKGLGNFRAESGEVDNVAIDSLLN